MNKHYVLSRVRTLTRRSHLAVAAVAFALGTLTSCNGYDDSNPNLPPIVPIPNSIAVADLNGAPGLLVATTADEGAALNPGYANVIVNNPPGTFQTGIHYSTTGTNPSSIAAADLTGGKGPVDIVIANFGSGSVSVFMHGSTTGSTFNAAVDVPTGGQPNQVVITDVNGDGKPDLVLADMSASGNVIVLLGDGTGKFGTPMNLSTGLTTTSVAVADLTGKGGLPSIVAATFDSSGNNGAVYIFPNNGGQFGTPKVYPAGPQPQSVKIADLGTGLLDIVVANLGPGADGKGTAGVSVLLQKADGTFADPFTYPTPGQSIDVAVGDLTGSGKMDLAVANLLPASTGSIAVLLHDDTTPGKFGTATIHTGLGQPLSVVISDLNNDGRKDIAVADGPAAGVLLQNPDGTFPAAETQVGY